MSLQTQVVWATGSSKEISAIIKRGEDFCVRTRFGWKVLIIRSEKRVEHEKSMESKKRICGFGVGDTAKKGHWGEE